MDKQSVHCFIVGTVGIRIRLIQFSITILFILTCCTKSELTIQEYTQWISDYNNGLHVRKDVGTLVLDLQYKPSQLVMAQRQGLLIKEETQTISDSLLQYFTLKIGTTASTDFLLHQAQNATDVQRNLYYYSYLFQNDLYIDYKGVRYPCVLYHFERATLQGKETIFNLAFEVPGVNHQSDDALTLVIASDHISSLPIRLEIFTRDTPNLQV